MHSVVKVSWTVKNAWILTVVISELFYKLCINNLICIIEKKCKNDLEFFCDIDNLLLLK
jgi:hypothetical protein